ncbi:cytochrome C [Alginatibacterium sediminis]|uniref:Cytochrome c-type protein n=1 Tax=Alginatibacterium sediminis TaxID=2164068 RepID=A0A420EJT1_9ALTE|nr:NapC/NirT family cytochrome c [Alginatibacterium sediminis]RKF20937.1 cytochrome C [Alginatibacterium sediminis]
MSKKFSRLMQAMRRRIWLGLPLGLFVFVGFIVFAVGGFQTMMHVTNQNEFCYACHVGMDTIVEEYQASPHFVSDDEVHATCADCHVPIDFVGKIVTKTKASADIYYMLIGTINMENFESERLRLAEHVWHEMEANDSQACRNCHNEEQNFDLAKQPARARTNHQKMDALESTCIDCHYGIAHKRPTEL